ncbi:glycosyltransferase family 2 protein [Paenibacillus lautus]
MTAMLVFILPGLNPHLSENTVSTVLRVFSNACPIVIQNEQESAATMNDALSDNLNSPWFMTLYAGDTVQPKAEKEIERWLQTYADSSAGFILTSVTKTDPPAVFPKRPVPTFTTPRGPLLWRTNIVMNGQKPGFTSNDQLPFQKYVLIDKQIQLSSHYEWTEVDSDGISYHHRAAPPWMKEAEEWNAISPLLHAPSRVQTINEKQSSPIVTIALCTFNDGEYLPWAIRSVLSQTITDWELIIVDDHSSDDTPSILAGLPIDKRINKVRLHQNLGKAHALNIALQMARGAWFLELDADDWLSPDILEVLLQEAKREPNVGVLYANHFEWVERLNKQLLYQGVRTGPSHLSAERLLAEAMAVAPRMFNVSVIEQLGGWNTSVPFEGRLYEDIEMLSKVSSFHPVYIPQPLYHRRIRSSSMTHRHLNHYEKWKNSMSDILK